MRVAILAPRDPIPIYSGLMERMYQLGTVLGSRHNVTLYYPDELSQRDEEGRIPDNPSFGRVGFRNAFVSTFDAAVPSYSALRGIYKTHPWLYRGLRSKLRKHRPDALVVEMPYLVPVALAARRGLDIPIILSEHNVEYKLAQRLDIGGSKLLKRFETAVTKRVDAVVTVSSTDKQTLESATSTPIRIAPNGVDIERFSPAAGSRNVQYNQSNPTIVYHGQLGNAQNSDAVDRLVNTLFPQIREKYPNALLVLVGPNPPLTSRDGVHVTGLVDDLPAHIASADLALVPLQAGSGTKLKILEYHASGTPVVTTPIGAEGLPLVDTKHALIAESDDGLIAATTRLLSEPSMAKELARCGRALAENRFAWSKTLEPYHEILSELAGDV